MILVFGDAQKLLGGWQNPWSSLGKGGGQSRQQGERQRALGRFGLSVASKFVFSLARDFQQKQAERTANTSSSLAPSRSETRTARQTADARETEHRFYGLLLAGICC